MTVGQPCRPGKRRRKIIFLSFYFSVKIFSFLSRLQRVMIVGSFDPRAEEIFATRGEQTVSSTTDDEEEH